LKCDERSRSNDVAKIPGDRSESTIRANELRAARGHVRWGDELQQAELPVRRAGSTSVPDVQGAPYAAGDRSPLLPIQEASRSNATARVLLYRGKGIFNDRAKYPLNKSWLARFLRGFELTF